MVSIKVGVSDYKGHPVLDLSGGGGGLTPSGASQPPKFSLTPTV